MYMFELLCDSIYDYNLVYRIGQNFCGLKTLPVAHILYCVKISAKFNFVNHARYPSGSSG